MLKYKRAKKVFEYRGIRWYSFDFQLERAIYCYLCCAQLKEKELNKLDENLRFESYRQWKQYIYNKYINFDKEKLMEFSRYLNLGRRNIKPSIEYLNIIISCFISVFLSLSFNIIFELYFKTSYITAKSLYIAIILLYVCFLFALRRIFKNTYTPIKDNNIDLNMYADYKEIIDSIIIENSEEK